jgi:hypothetical protein
MKQINDGLTQKQRARAELEQLVADYRENDGMISRERGRRVMLSCETCRSPFRGRLCCKTRFAPMIKNSKGRRRGFRVKM